MIRASAFVGRDHLGDAGFAEPLTLAAERLGGGEVGLRVAASRRPGDDTRGALGQLDPPEDPAQAGRFSTSNTSAPCRRG